MACRSHATPPGARTEPSPGPPPFVAPAPPSSSADRGPAAPDGVAKGLGAVPPGASAFTAGASPAASASAAPAASGVSGAPSSSPQVPSALAPAPSASEPGGRLWASCYDRFEPSDTPRIDVVRLGTVCGPSNGLSLYGRMTGVVDEARAPARYQWDAEAGDCFRVFAVAAEPVSDLEVEIAWVVPHAEDVSLTNQNRRWAVVGEDRAFCATHDGTMGARFSTHGGRGAVVAAVWRGERMLPVSGKRTKL